MTTTENIFKTLEESEELIEEVLLDNYNQGETGSNKGKYNQGNAPYREEYRTNSETEAYLSYTH